MTLPESYEYVRLFASFIVVVIVIYALYYYLNNYTSIKKGGKIKIVESKMIGKNRFLVLCQIKDKELLLGSDEKGITILKEWDKEES